MQPTHIIIHYGEIGLKGKNQSVFLDQLQRNVQSHIKHLGLAGDIKYKRGYFSIDVSTFSNESINRLSDRLSLTPGIVWFAHAYRITAPAAELIKTLPTQLIELAQKTYSKNKTFAVRVNRSDKNFPITSGDLEKQLGAEIISATDWDQVNLNDPDQTFHVSMHVPYYGEGAKGGTYIYIDKQQGPGGLPVKTSDKILTLLSGGIDSPVAAYLAARRGCPVDFIHFTATPLQHKEAESYKVSKLAEHLSIITQTSRLYLVSYTHFDTVLLGKTSPFELMIFRRFMARVAQKIAEQNNITALVTGDNLSQVASQTLSNIASLTQAVELPILRPLVTYDKNEIIQLAKHIGTYDLSIESYKDCCSLISQNPRTKSNHEALSKTETKLIPNYEQLIADTLKDMIVLDYKNGNIINK